MSQPSSRREAPHGGRTSLVSSTERQTVGAERADPDFASQKNGGSRAVATDRRAAHCTCVIEIPRGSYVRAPLRPTATDRGVVGFVRMLLDLVSADNGTTSVGICTVPNCVLCLTTFLVYLVRENKAPCALGAALSPLSRGGVSLCRRGAYLALKIDHLAVGVHDFFTRLDARDAPHKNKKSPQERSRGRREFQRGARGWSRRWGP